MFFERILSNISLPSDYTRIICHSQALTYIVNVLNLYTNDDVSVNKSSYNYGLGGLIGGSDNSCYPHLISNPYCVPDNIVEQSIWVLGNIAGDETDLREYVMKLGKIKCFIMILFFFFI
jgi:hypothetical protein